MANDNWNYKKRPSPRRLTWTFGENTEYIEDIEV